MRKSRDLDSCHQRWFERRTRNQDEPSYKDEWWAQQCIQCRFFVPLTGDLGHDFGACTNESSEWDQRVMYEHDGCSTFDVDPDLVDNSLE